MLSPSEFKDEIFARLRSPFFGSFAISWLILNWRIPVALIFYKHDDVSKDGYRSYEGLIASNFTELNTITLPLFTAFCYVMFVKPILAIGLASIQTITDDNVNAVSKTEMMPSRYFTPYKLKYENSLKNLQSNEEEIKELQSKIQTLEGQAVNDYGTIQSRDSVIIDLNGVVSALRSINDTSIMKGEWEVTYHSEVDEEIEKIENWRIKNNQVTIDLSDNQHILFFQNYPEASLRMLVGSSSDIVNNPFKLIEVQPTSNGNEYRGILNLTSTINLKKIADIN